MCLYYWYVLHYLGGIFSLIFFQKQRKWVGNNWTYKNEWNISSRNHNYSCVQSYDYDADEIYILMENTRKPDSGLVKKIASVLIRMAFLPSLSYLHLSLFSQGCIVSPVCIEIQLLFVEIPRFLHLQIF